MAHFRFPFLAAAMLAVAGLLCSASPLAAQAGSHGTVRLDPPKGVKAEGFAVTVFEEDPSPLRNAWSPVKAFTADAEGIVTLEYTPTDMSQLEVTGDGVRRARFPFPNPEENVRPVFHLRPGFAADLHVLDGESGEAVAGALIGPIYASMDVAADVLQDTFPLFARTDAKGDAHVTGLPGEGGYDAFISADGYAIQSIKLQTKAPQTVSMIGGGLTWHGVVLGEKSMKPIPEAIVRVESQSWSLALQVRADIDGKFSVAGLAEGSYTVAAQDAMADSMRATHLILNKESAGPDWMIYVPEGIDIQGLVADIETGAPVPGATLQLNEQIVKTGENGAFAFRQIRGPWPRYIEFQHPEYEFRAADQSLASYPFNGYEGYDLKDIVLSARRLRVLEVLVGAAAEPVRAMLDLYPVSDSEAEIHAPITSLETVMPLASGGDRIAIVRDQSDAVSEVVALHTALDQTTTTLAVQLGAPASLSVKVTYEGEEAAPAYKLTVYTRKAATGAHIELASANAGEDGASHLTRLPPGVFDVELSQNEGAPLLGQTVELHRGQTTPLNLTVPRGNALSGVVSDESGKQLGEIPVVIYAKDARGGDVTLKAMTKDDGGFEFKGLGGNSVRSLQINHSHYAPLTLDHIQLPANPLQITLKAKQGIVVTIPAAAGAADAKAIVLTSVRNPAPDGTLQWFGTIDKMENFAGNSSVTVTPEHEGRLRVAVVAGGKWDVSEPMDWHAKDKSPEVDLQPGITSTLRVDVEGVVSEEELQALDATLINTTLPEEMTPTSFAATTRQQSRLTFADVPAGDYIIIVSAPDGATATLGNIEMESGKSKTVSLKLSADTVRLDGRVVVDDGHDSPVSGAEVKLFFNDVPEEEAMATAVTDAGGEFTIPQLLPSRSYVIIIHHAERSYPFQLAVGNSKEDISEVYTIRIPRRYTVRVPANLNSRATQNPGTPFIFRSSNGEVELLRIAAGTEAFIFLSPGSYTVSWGESELGPVEAPKSSSVITLPDLPQ